jgi:hypothetical protein
LKSKTVGSPDNAGARDQEKQLAAGELHFWQSLALLALLAIVFSRSLLS